MDFRAGRTVDGSRDPSTIVQGDVASSPLIATGDMVVFFEGREAIGFDRMKSKAIWQCRHGAFHHDDMLGKPFGSRVYSRTTKGFVYTLSPTPELWSHVVPNRTQIVQDFDQSIVIFRLNLKPGDVVVESGTGSGVMSSSIMRTIAPTGFLHSFEFNEVRATRAQEEFEENGLGGLSRVVHRDVCAAKDDGGGFGEDLNGKADAVFLDLPEPWLAVPHARVVLKADKKVCSYSPCIEQAMKTCEALRSEGFHSITTIEFRLRSINHTAVKLETPDFGYSAARSKPTSQPAASASTPSSTAAAASTAPSIAQLSSTPPSGKAPSDRGENPTGNGGESVRASNGACSAAAKTSEGGIAAESGGRGVSATTVNSMDVAKAQAQPENGTACDTGSDSTNGSGKASSGKSADADDIAKPKSDESAASSSGARDDVADVGSESAKGGKHKRSREESEGVDSARGAAGRDTAADLSKYVERRRPPPKAAGIDPTKPPVHLVCAQPYPIMRGHTAFLTFATTPVVRHKVAAQGAAASSNTVNDAEGGSCSTAAKSSTGADPVDCAAGGANRHAEDAMDVVSSEDKVPSEERTLVERGEADGSEKSGKADDRNSALTEQEKSESGSGL